MKKILAILSLFLFLVPLMSLASPVPLAYIINDESKECAVHRGGDECVSHPIPEGWRYTGLAGYTEVNVKTDSRPVWSIYCLMPFSSGSNYTAMLFWPIIIVAIVIIIVVIRLIAKKRRKRCI